MSSSHRIIGQVADIQNGRFFPAEVIIEGGRITAINPLPSASASPLSSAPSSPSSTSQPSSPASQPGLPYILPGFIDAHVHIESSLLIPSEFARLAVVHGTVATVSDPHEIANVCGLPGIEFMIQNGHTVPFHFNFGAPSCVPATTFETAGATLDAAAVEKLLASDDIKYLSEMMNFPGVLHQDPEVMAKIAAAKRLNKPVDGHAPGLRGAQAKVYIDAGISTDHECFTAEEALDKLRYGMKILIREGSAARNFEALIGLLHDYPDQIMFCSDDKHPDSLLAGHIDRFCARAVAKGIDIFKVLKAACLNPVLHYKLDTGLLRVGDPANCIVVEDLQNFKVLQTYIKGQLVAENGVTRIPSSHLLPAAAPVTGSSLLIADPVNNFNCEPHTPADFAYPLDKWGEEENVEQVYVIEALDGQLITNKLIVPISEVQNHDNYLHANPSKDILKIVVVNRYQPAPVAKSFIRNVGLQRGALASSVAHDSHNIVAVGVDDESICRAINLVIAQKGGLSAVDPGAGIPPSFVDPGIPSAAPTQPTQQSPQPQLSLTSEIASPSHSADPNSSQDPDFHRKSVVLPLPVGGLMSLDDGYAVAGSYTAIDQLAKSMGSTLAAPFMTLSFMALLVIPHLKLSDLGLFDGDQFKLL